MTPLAPVPMLTLTAGEKPPASAGTFPVDLADILEYGLFVQGMTRSGKTNFVRYIVERAHGLVPIYILDVEGEYPTLRTEGRPFLVVGKGRDYEVAADRDDVQQLVHDLVARHISAIFDLSEYEEDEVQLIIAAFCDAVVALPENHPGEKLVIIDELQESAPEGGGKGTALNSVRRLSKRGLKRGFALLGASQRTADVSNGVLTQLKSKAVGASDDADVAKALLQLGLGPRSRQALSELEQGEFWVKGPAFSRHAVHVRIPRAESSPAKRRRGEGAAPASKASGEIAELAASLAAAAAARAEAQATDERKVRRVRDVDAGEDDDEITRPDPAEIEAARAAGVIEGVASERARWNRVCGVLATFAGGARTEVIEVLSKLQNVGALLEGMHEEATQGCAATAIAPAPAREVLATPLRDAPAATRATKPKRVPVHQRLLDALARLEALGAHAVGRQLVAVFAAATPTSSATERAFADLLRDGALTVPRPGEVSLTARGRASAVPSDVPATLVEYHERWRELLDPAPLKLFDALVQHGRGAIATREGLANAAGLTFTSSATERVFATLIKLNLFDAAARGMVRGTALLFPEGLR